MSLLKYGDILRQNFIMETLMDRLVCTIGIQVLGYWLYFPCCCGWVNNSLYYIGMFCGEWFRLVLTFLNAGQLPLVGFDFE